MSVKIEDAVPPPHLFSGRSTTWPSSYASQTSPLGSSPAAKSPQAPQPYACTQEKALPSHSVSNLPSSGWYDPSMAGNGFQVCAVSQAAEVMADAGTIQYSGYDHYPPPRCSVVLSPTSPSLSQAAQVPSSIVHSDTLAKVISPMPVYPQSSLLNEVTHQSVELPQALKSTPQQSPGHVKRSVHVQESPRGRFTVAQPIVEATPWAVDSLGIQTPSVPSEAYYASFAQHVRGLRTGAAAMEMAVTAPQPRREFTHIAPQPADTPRSTAAKRLREDEDQTEMSKRRRRSESTTSTQLELTDEDKLLLRLKEEECMPWKEIAARFQGDLGKQYQIPALQMRLKRLRERMRVWSEADVRALRMAHEYWAQNKFDIISQKMLEFGAQEKWTARQCARRWAESDGLPTPVAQYEQQTQHTYTPYSMSPAEPATSFLPYMHP